MTDIHIKYTKTCCKDSSNFGCILDINKSSMQVTAILPRSCQRLKSRSIKTQFQALLVI